MEQTGKTIKNIAWIFFSTGIFAIVGALYTWGEGPLYYQDDLLTALVPWADLVITGPISILAAYGINTKKHWGMIAGLLACGIYLFGSVLVYITLIWEGAPYPLQLALPPLAGIAISIGYPYWIIRQMKGNFQRKAPFQGASASTGNKWQSNLFWSGIKDQKTG